MIVDFTVSNFRSIKEAQTLSFYAQRKTEHLADNIHYPAEAKIGVLTSAGIYGANASGKSNFLLALKALSEFVSETGGLAEEELIEAYEPYRLSNETKNAPTNFELEFVLNGERYLYKVSFDAKRIYSEYLGFYPSGRTRSVPAALFNREQEHDWKSIKFGSLFTGGKLRHALFLNNSYLSKAGNSADSPKQIRDVYQYIRNNIVFIELGRFRSDPKWKKDKNLINTISKLLSVVDVGISRVDVRKEDKSDFFSDFPVDVPEAIKEKILEDVSNVPYFEHLTEDGTSEFFDESLESMGTRQLVHILPLLFNIITKGKVLIWDEIESSLHPHIAELIIKLFNDPSVNVNHAQLLFTTHNMALMNQHTMRKDQLWLTEKHQGATSISSLEDFSEDSLKSNSPFAKWYDEGRLGGIPAVNYGIVRDLMTPKREGDEDAEA
jgi:AAA15 family ATPase/GTPase